MKRSFLLLFIYLLNFISTHAVAESLPAQVTIGFTSNANPEILKHGSDLISKALEKELGVSVKTVTPPKSSDLVESLKTKKVDFAFLSARNFVEAERTLGAKVLLKKVWAGPFYYSVIIVKKNSKISRPEDLKGKKIAFVDKNSASGFLYPQVMFKKKGIKEGDFKGTQFSGGHPESVQLLEAGSVDAIAVFSNDTSGKKSAFVKFSKSKNPAEEFRVVWVSDPIPNDPFCVRKDFYESFPKLTHSLMFALIDTAESLKDEKALEDILGGGFMPATSRQYDAVREMVKELGPPIE